MLANTVDVLLKREGRTVLSRLIESGRIEENSISTGQTVTLMNGRTLRESVEVG